MVGSSWSLIIAHAYLVERTRCHGIVCFFVFSAMSSQDKNPPPDPPVDPGHSGLSWETVDAMVKRSFETQLAALARQSSSASVEAGGT